MATIIEVKPQYEPADSIWQIWACAGRKIKFAREIFFDSSDLFLGILVSEFSFTLFISWGCGVDWARSDKVHRAEAAFMWSTKYRSGFCVVLFNQRLTIFQRLHGCHNSNQATIQSFRLYLANLSLRRSQDQICLGEKFQFLGSFPRHSNLWIQFYFVHFLGLWSGLGAQRQGAPRQRRHQGPDEGGGGFGGLSGSFKVHAHLA